MSLDAKHAAAELSVALNDAAAIFALAAVVSAPFGAVGAVAFGVASGLSWLVGNEYADLANDPPRSDYQLVERFRPAEAVLPPTAGEDGRVWADFGRIQMEMAEATAALVVSFERLAGARSDLQRQVADPDFLARHIAAQRQAIKHNAAAAKRRISQLLSLRSAVNAAWRNHAEDVRARIAAMSEEERRLAAEAAWERIAPSVSGALGDQLQLLNIRQFIERTAQAPIEIRDEVLDSRWRETMLNMDKRLALLAGEQRLVPLRQEVESIVLARDLAHQV